MTFVDFLSNFTNGLFRHFVCFEKFHSPISELIHLARCVKINPYFIPGIVLIVFCGTQSNRKTNFIPRLAGFNPASISANRLFRNRGQESKKESEEKFKVCVLLFLFFFFVDCETFSFLRPSVDCMVLKARL